MSSESIFATLGGQVEEGRLDKYARFFLQAGDSDQAPTHMWSGGNKILGTHSAKLCLGTSQDAQDMVQEAIAEFYDAKVPLPLYEMLTENYTFFCDLEAKIKNGDAAGVTAALNGETMHQVMLKCVYDFYPAPREHTDFATFISAGSDKVSVRHMFPGIVLNKTVHEKLLYHITDTLQHSSDAGHEQYNAAVQTQIRDVLAAASADNKFKSIVSHKVLHSNGGLRLPFCDKMEEGAGLKGAQELERGVVMAVPSTKCAP